MFDPSGSRHGIFRDGLRRSEAVGSAGDSGQCTAEPMTADATREAPGRVCRALSAKSDGCLPSALLSPRGLRPQLAWYALSSTVSGSSAEALREITPYSQPLRR